MDIDGTYTLQAPPEVVWNLLMDQDLLQHTIQGMERLEQTEKIPMPLLCKSNTHLCEAPILEMQLSRSWSILTRIIWRPRVRACLVYFVLSAI